jgi:Putative prokaryotic signal transducing protein
LEDSMSEDLAVILSTMDHGKAQLVKTLLDSSGILAEILTSKTTHWGMDVIQAVGMVDVVVGKSDEADARALLAEVDSGSFTLDDKNPPPTE